MSSSSSSVRSIQSSVSGVAGAQGAGDLAQQVADPVVDDVDLMRGAAVAQRRPHEQVDEHADRDADPDVEQPRGQHPAVVAVARGEHDDRRRGGRGRLAAQPAHGAGGQADQHGEAERHGADPEEVPGRECHEHADDGRRHLLHSAAQRPEDRRVDGQQRGPRREERLRDVEAASARSPRRGRRRAPSSRAGACSSRRPGRAGVRGISRHFVDLPRDLRRALPVLDHERRDRRACGVGSLHGVDDDVARPVHSSGVTSTVT